MPRVLLLSLLLVPLLAACAQTGPVGTTAGISTGTSVGGTHARVGASTSTWGRGVNVGIGLGRTIR